MMTEQTGRWLQPLTIRSILGLIPSESAVIPLLLSSVVIKIEQITKGRQYPESQAAADLTEDWVEQGRASV